MTISLTVIAPDGQSKILTVSAQNSLMEALRDAGINGITAECNGHAACATCHVYCAPPHGSSLPAIGAQEDDMLEFTASPRLPESRLSCQIALAPQLDGMVVTLPQSQY